MSGDPIKNRREQNKGKYLKKIDSTHQKAFEICFSSDAGRVVLNHLYMQTKPFAQNTPITSMGVDKDMMLINEGFKALYLEIRRQLPPETVFMAENYKKVE